jgi:outer membrane receptor protein involved in Fe transport
MHPEADGAEIRVTAGDRLPGVPVHSAKAGLIVAPLPRLQVGADVQALSGVILRGDEANLLPGVSGFTRLDLRARYRLTRDVGLVAQLHNVFDEEYATFGILGDPELIDAELTDPRFFSPGEPRGLWAGVEVRF